MSVGADIGSYLKGYHRPDCSYPCSSRRREIGAERYCNRLFIYPFNIAQTTKRSDCLLHLLCIASVKVSMQPHILSLDLFILASSGHLLYRWRVHTDIGRSSYGLRLYTKSYTISYHSFICIYCTSIYKPLSYLVPFNQTKFIQFLIGGQTRTFNRTQFLRAYLRHIVQLWPMWLER